MYIGVHGELNDEPGRIPQDEGGDQVPVDDVPQTPNTPDTDRGREEEVRTAALIWCILTLTEGVSSFKVQSAYAYSLYREAN